MSLLVNHSRKTIGMCDAALKPRQERMRGYGYTFAANGLYGDMLGAALQLQRANGVEGTGGNGPRRGRPHGRASGRDSRCHRV